MKSYKIIVLILLVLTLAFGVTAQKKKKPKKKKMNKTETTKPMPLPDEQVFPPGVADGNNVLPKIIMQKDRCGEENPFVFVARDAETYQQLQKKMTDLPSADTIDFKKNAIVSAFLGTRPTPGYKIVIKNSGNVVRINESAPPAGTMVAQVLTSPCAVALISLQEENDPLQFNISPTIAAKPTIYKVKTGEFTQSGGFAGRQQSFKFDGTVSVWQTGELITLSFGLSEKGIAKGRTMTVTASGYVSKDGNVTLPKFDSTGFVEPPGAPLKATGKMTGNSISLAFESLPTNVADGFDGAGKLEASK